VEDPSDSDKGQVSCFDCQMKDVTFFATCLALHIIFNTVVGVLLGVFIPTWITKHNGSSATTSLFWSTAIIGVLMVFAFIIGEVVVGVVIGKVSHIKSPVIFVATTCLLLVFLLTAELIVAIVRSKRSELVVPRSMGYCCSVFCFCFFCCCCRPRGQSHSRVARALALWFVMAWFQSIASSVVPVTITVLTSSPLLMLATLALLISTVCCFIVFLAVLVHMCGQHDCSKHCTLFIYLVVLVGFLVMVCLVIFMLLLITSYGAQVNSIAGFIATLVPSAIVSTITWFVKTKVLGKKPTEADQSKKQAEEIQAEEKQGENCMHTIILWNLMHNVA